VSLRRAAQSRPRTGSNHDDLRLLSSGPNTGLAGDRSAALQPAHRLLPGKVTPFMAELTAMVGFQTLRGHATAMAVQAGQLE